MFSLALLIGIYSYLIFAIGLVGFLHKEVVTLLTLGYFLLNVYFFRKDIKQFLRSNLRLNLKSKSQNILLAIISTLVLINLIGALGPELGFDALWYHLTLPKLYLINNTITHFTGNLLYYSDMPKLTEMLYAGALSLGSEITAKLVHFAFGILSAIALYKLARMFFDSKISLVSVLIFYSNLVVGWLSITAYVDLARTFFEIMALWGFLKWAENKERKWLIESAVMLGLAISTKLIAAGSLFIFTVLIIVVGLQKHRQGVWSIITNMLVYWWLSMLISLPWFVFSFMHTGNPIYPFFTSLYGIDFDVNLINPMRFVSDIWVLFTRSADPVSPIYLMFLPLVILAFRKFQPLLKIVVFYSLFAIVIWYFTPRTGGGRFIVPYLSALSIITVSAIGVLLKNKNKLNIKLANFCIIIVIFVGIISIFYRGFTNTKYMPVIVGQESKSDFLIKHLNFKFGDFYDTDSYFKKHIEKNDTVLLYGFHNLYYVDFPFIDSSWVKKGDRFNYIAVQESTVPKRFSYWNLIYENPKTSVKLYSLGGQEWVY